MQTLGQAIHAGQAKIPLHEAEILVLEAIWAATGESLKRSDLYLRREDEMSPLTQQIYDQWLVQRARGIPLQYVTGFQHFLGHRYRVGPAVLIPRPETEFLVSECVESLARRDSQETVVWEIGLGSGVISLELLGAFPHVRVWASEVSAAARKLAVLNAHERLGGLDRLALVEPESPSEVLGPFFRNHAPRANLIVSNPPYLTRSEAEVTQEAATHEPAIGLFAPAEDPLHFYRKIFEGAEQALAPHGEVWLEVPHERADQILNLATKAKFDGELLKDLTGRDRVLRAKWIA